jgi:diacylglycerol kinase family enzyme
MEHGVNVPSIAKNEDPEVVFVAAGGDGTVNAVAGAVAGTGRCMGVLPVGTLNHFARDLGLPLDMPGAVAAICAGEARSVDAGEVNGAVFVNNSSLGAYPMMVLDRERMKKGGWGKWAALVVASAKAFVRFHCLDVKLEVEGRAQHCTTPFVFIGNNEYCLEGTRLGARERMDGGELSVYLAPGATRGTVLWMALAALFGRLKQVPEYTEYNVTSLTVGVMRKRRRGLRVSRDGEVGLLWGPLEYRTLPGALRVLGARLVPGEAE